MENNFNFEVYLLISPKKISLSVYKKKDFGLIYKNEILIDNFSNDLNFEKLDKFLNENIFKVEKILDNFIQNINIAIFSKDLFELKISVKKNNLNKIIDNTDVIYLLNDAKNDSKSSLKNNKIIHILIDNYLIDNNHYLKLPVNLKCESFSLNLSFVCLPENLTRDIEKILEDYQISVNQYISAKYIEEFSKKGNLNFFQGMRDIIDGTNANEVKLVQKKPKNKGFFERFFDFFS